MSLYKAAIKVIVLSEHGEGHGLRYTLGKESLGFSDFGIA